MSVLFARDEKTVRKYINNVFSEGELEKNNNTHFLRFFAPFYELTDFRLFLGGYYLNRFNRSNESIQLMR